MLFSHIKLTREACNLHFLLLYYNERGKKPITKLFMKLGMSHEISTRHQINCKWNQ